MLTPQFLIKYKGLNGNAHYCLAQYDFNLKRTFDFRDLIFNKNNMEKINAR